MKKSNPLTNSARIPLCKIKFDVGKGNTHISQILTGYKLLDNMGILKIKKASPEYGFRSRGKYEHNSIVEVEIDNKTVAYDMADGYQSIHRKDIFDKQLDNLDFYFKRSYDPDFHKDMRNADKVKPLGLNYLCSCKNNPYDRFISSGFSVSEIIRYIRYIKNNNANICLYQDFESNEKIYDEYKLLFLTRIWDESEITAEGIAETYPYLSTEKAAFEAEKWRASLKTATEKRIEYIKGMRKYFGDKAVAGISRSALAEKICPELIVDDCLSDKKNYMKMIKENYICVTSEGLHKSIGWKFAEYVAAGKAVITEPPAYVIPGNFTENINYLVYNDMDSLIEKCELLLENTEKTAEMEKANRIYYKNHLSPDQLILDSLKYLYK